jgi:hypothetical protein
VFAVPSVNAVNMPRWLVLLLIVLVLILLLLVVIRLVGGEHQPVRHGAEASDSLATLLPQPREA